MSNFWPWGLRLGCPATGKHALFNAVPATDGETLKLTLSIPSGKSIEIRWGDGNVTPITGPQSATAYTNTYTNSGTYPVIFAGDYDAVTHIEVADVSVDGGIEWIFGPLTGLTYVKVAVTNTLSGDIAEVNDGITYVRFSGSNSISDYSGKDWSNNVGLNYVYFITGAGGGLSTAKVDQLLIDLDTDLTWSGGTIQFTGTNAARSSASDTAVNNLVAEGVTVTTN